MILNGVCMVITLVACSGIANYRQRYVGLVGHCMFWMFRMCEYLQFAKLFRLSRKTWTVQIGYQISVFKNTSESCKCLQRRFAKSYRNFWAYFVFQLFFHILNCIFSFFFDLYIDFFTFSFIFLFLFVLVPQLFP